MMARSTTRCNQRQDTLMQDRICQVDETSCNARPDHTLGQSLPKAIVPAMSAFPPRATEERTWRHVSKVPLAEVALIRSPRRQGRAPWPGWSLGQPGFSQSFFVSREVFGTPIRAHHVFESGNS